MKWLRDALDACRWRKGVSLWTLWGARLSLAALPYMVVGALSVWLSGEPASMRFAAGAVELAIGWILIGAASLCRWKGRRR